MARLEIALELGLGARRPDHDLERLARISSTASVGGRSSVPAARSITATGSPASAVGGSARSRVMAAAIRRQVVHPDGQLVGLVHPVAWWRSRRAGRPGSGPAALSSAARVEHPDQRGDAVLVRHRLGVDAVADRLLVAERQARHPADPLEAGQGVGERLAVRGGHRRQQRAGDDRAGVGAAYAAAQRVVAQQRAELVAGSIRQVPSTTVGHRAPVGVRVVGDHQVGADLARPGPGPGRSRRAPPGWGRPPSGSPGRAAACSATTVGGREAGRAPRPARPATRRPRAAGCRPSRRARGASGGHQRRRPGPGRPRPARRRAWCRPPSGARRSAVRSATSVDPGRDLGVGRRHDLRAVARGRPCSRCPAAGCATRSPPRRPRSRGAGCRRRPPGWAAGRR